MQRYNFSGFPVLHEEMFLGFVGREKLRLALGLPCPTYLSLLILTMSVEQLLGERSPAELAQECSFSSTHAASEPGFIDLSSLMEVSVLELRTEVPLELVVNMIQKMVCLFPLVAQLNKAPNSLQNVQQILFTQQGKLMGLITKSDIVDLLTAHLPHRAALADFVEGRRG